MIRNIDILVISILLLKIEGEIISYRILTQIKNKMTFLTR